MKPYDDIPPRGKVTMQRISPASEVGECWVCGRRSLWHRLLGWLLRHPYDPIREPGGFHEIQRLARKYGGE